jgi:hypothetical protein
MELFRVDYLELTQLSDFYGRTIAWPDPLYPVSLGETVIFPAGVNQPLWVRVRIPKNASPGTYTGAITIGLATVPVTLTVWNFSLPDTPLIETMAGFNWDLVMETYGGTNGGVPQDCYDKLENALSSTLSDFRIADYNKNDLPEDVALYSLTSYEIKQAHQLQLSAGKRVWWGSSPIDHPPHINPFVIDRPGVESRYLPWLAWMDRVDDFYYPQSVDWDPDPWLNPFSNGLNNGDGFLFYPPKDSRLGFNPCITRSNRQVPSIRLELLREGLDDYAYFWLLNQGKPKVNQANAADPLVRSIVKSRTVVNRIPTAFAPIRQAIAQQLEARQQQVYLPILIH